jgi:hypothetical protein
MIKSVLGFFDIPSQLSKIINMLEIQNMKIDEATRLLEAHGDLLEKILLEVVALKESLANIDLPEATTAAIARIEGLAGRIDEVNEDAPVPQPE